VRTLSAFTRGLCRCTISIYRLVLIDTSLLERVFTLCTGGRMATVTAPLATTGGRSASAPMLPRWLERGPPCCLQQILQLEVLAKCQCPSSCHIGCLSLAAI
jgi:hypothetical protein